MEIRQGRKRYPVTKNFNRWLPVFLAARFKVVTQFGFAGHGGKRKVENHKRAIGLHYMYYNFARIHQALRLTPAMEVGVKDHVWAVEEIAGLLHADPARTTA